MSEGLVTVLAVISVLIIIGLLIKEAVDHGEARGELDQAYEDITSLCTTLDRYRREKEEANAIADHAIEVIAEAKYITARTIHEARISELQRAFVDRRQREQNEKELQDEIDNLTGGNL